MDDRAEQQVEQSNISEMVDKTPLYIYILYLSSMLVGVTFIIAGVWAFVAESDDPRIKSHLENAKKIFIWGLVGYVIGFILSMVVVGIFVLVGMAIWVLYRSIKGLVKFNKGEAYPL
jgi:uncharacterized membrane protein